ncbi:MAG: monovalent cation/H(+) antiporter subunit G [Nitriliruptoraceae bacterium]
MPVVAYALMLLGSVLILLAGGGVLRFPDVFTRANAATKAAGLGLACVLLGVAVAIGTWEAGIKLGLAALLQFASAPIAGHVMGRAAYRSGAPLARSTHFDDLAETVERRDPDEARR